MRQNRGNQSEVPLFIGRVSTGSLKAWRTHDSLEVQVYYRSTVQIYLMDEMLF